jgi:hypothetical protein
MLAPPITILLDWVECGGGREYMYLCAVACKIENPFSRSRLIKMSGLNMLLLLKDYMLVGDEWEACGGKKS